MRDAAALTMVANGRAPQQEVWDAVAKRTTMSWRIFWEVPVTKKRVLVTGAAGYVASRMLPAFRERYDLTLLDSSAEPSPDRAHSKLGPVEGVQVADLLDPDRGAYAHHFEGVDAVVHLAYIRRRGEPIDQYESQRENVDMAYNVFRAAYDAGVERVVAASSNHAANWYEPALLQPRKMESLDPYDLPPVVQLLRLVEGDVRTPLGSYSPAARSDGRWAWC